MCSALLGVIFCLDFHLFYFSSHVPWASVFPLHSYLFSSFFLSFFQLGFLLGYDPPKWYIPVIILGRKWSQTNFETKILLSQLGSFSWGQMGVCCSHQVPNVFLKMFPIASHFHPICFAKKFPLFTYIIGPNGRHYVYRISYCDELPKFQLNIFLW